MNAKKVVITSKGDTDVIRIVDFDLKDPLENQVQIRVEFAGLAYGDLMIRRFKLPGLPEPPVTPGSDVSGIIEKVGKGIQGFTKGDRVTALLGSDFGGQSQFVNVDANKVMHIPRGVPSQKAVCLLINYLTAYEMMVQSGLAADSPSNVLVHGGSGGVGSALIQIASSWGHRIFSTVSKKNLEMVKAMGADGIDYESEDFVSSIKDKAEMDYVYNCIGGDYLRRSLSIMRKGGVYTGYGFQNDFSRGMGGVMKSIISFIFRKITTPNKKLNSFVLDSHDQSEHNRSLSALYEMYKKGEIDPIISEILSMEDAKKAHLKLEKGERQGKILINCSPN